MNRLVKRISFKILVISMITVILSFFSVSSVSEAKLKLEEGQFYYTGTQEANLVVTEGFFAGLLKALAEIANYILGIQTLGVRGVIVGWIEIMEIILTALLGVETDFGQFISDSIAGMDGYSQQIVNVEKIIFNEVPILDANIFKNIDQQSDDPTADWINKEGDDLEPTTQTIQLNQSGCCADNGEALDEDAVYCKQCGYWVCSNCYYDNHVDHELGEKTYGDYVNEANEAIEQQKEKEKDKNYNIVQTIKKSVAKWYYIMRLIVIAFMLLLLIFIGIKMAISTIASEKAVYQQMLLDWVAGMIIVFSIHYIMIFILDVNDTIVETLKPLAAEPSEIVREDEFGDEKNLKTGGEIETTLYESVRTRAYSMKLTDGFTGLIIYGVLVYYAWRFALIYFRRVINIIILTLTAPAVSASYAFNKVVTGKPKIFSTWLSEYIMNVIIQLVHIIIYVSFVSVALQLSLASLSGIVLAFVLLNFMVKADKILRQLFKLTGGKGSLAGDMADRTGFKQLKEDAQGLKNAMIGGTITKAAMKGTYGLAMKPVKAAGMAALGTTVAAVQNKEIYKKHQEKKAEKEKEKYENIAKDYLENNEQAKEKMAEIEKLEKENYELLAQEQKLKAKLKQQKKEEDKAKVQAELDKNQAEIEKKNKQIKTKEDELKKDFSNYQINNGGSIYQVFKGNLGEALRGLTYKDEKGRYRRKRNYEIEEYTDKKGRTKTRKKSNVIKEGGLRGGRKGAFWRKTVYSTNLTFKNNMKLGKLFGLDDAEEKELKNIADFWKNRIIGLGSLVVGFPTLVTNPLVGMALLSKGGVTHLNAKARRKRYINRVAKGELSYTFKGFGDGTITRLSRAASYNMVEFDKLETLKHKRVRKEVKNVMKWAKAMEKREETIRTTTQTLQSQYIKIVNDYEESIKKNVSDKSSADLAFAQKVREKTVVNVGNGICMQLQTNRAMQKFMNKIETIDSKPNISQKTKINMIKQEMAEQKELIIKEGIMTLCEQNGIDDIINVQLTDAEMVQINENILEIVESTGIVKKGEIDLEEANINEEAISKVYLDLTSNHEETNQELESNLVSSAILEYMETKGEQQVSNLNSEEAKQEIFDIIKDKLMPKSSKKSASVIAKLTGKDKIKEEFELPESIKESVEKNTKKVKKIKKRRFNKRSTRKRKRKISRKRS